MTEDQNGPLALPSFGSGWNAAVVGASGGIGRAFAEELGRCPGAGRVFHLSRRQLPGDWRPLDLEDETSISDAAAAIKQEVSCLHLVVVATGMLHSDQIQPEKTWRRLERALYGKSVFNQLHWPLAGGKTLPAAVGPGSKGGFGDGLGAGWQYWR